MVADFVRAVRARDTASGATIASALPSHFAALAAEAARVTGARVDIAAFTAAGGENL